MAKKKDASAETEAVKASEVEQQITPKKLKALLKSSNEAFKNTREISGELGQKIAEAVEKDHLHRKAFAILKGFDRMTPEKLSDVWDTLNYYMDVSGLAERAKSALKMNFEAADDEDEGETDTNVTGFPAPATARH
jgi:hypothetical protein